LLEELNLPEKKLQRILWENAAAVLGLG